MPKVPTATLEEVEAVQKQLEEKIADLKKALEKQIKSVEKKADENLAGEVKEVKESLAKLSGSVDERVEELHGKLPAIQEQALEAVEGVRQEEHAYRPVIEKFVTDVREQLLEKFDKADSDTRGLFAEELEALCGKFDQELTELKASLEVQVRKVEKEAAEALHAQIITIPPMIQAVEEQAKVQDGEVARAAAEELQKVVEAQALVDKDINKAIKKAQAEASERSSQLEAELRKQAAEAHKALHTASSGHSSDLEQKTAEHIARFEAVDQQIEKLWATSNDMENNTTRKVEWVIKNASKSLRQPKLERPDDKPQMRSWKSVPFDVAGTHGCVLELQIFPKADPPAEDEEKGDCVVTLTAGKGMNLAFKLTIGSATQVFEHKFVEEGKPFVSKRMCFYSEQIAALTDTLRIGVEILESLYELRVEPQPVELEDPEEVPLDYHLQLQRFISNRVFDQVKAQMDMFKARMIRKVEWRLEEASMMRPSFPKGAPIISREFDAAGVNGLQFIFYPSGYDGQADGWCSAFLSAPAGLTIKCVLQVGAERRELSHVFEKAGYFGRAAFCRFDNAVDAEEDTVLLSLDIIEAQLDVVAASSHPPPATVGLRNLSKAPATHLPIGSSLKLTKTMDRLPPVLQEVKVLPSLWSRRNIYEPMVRKDGLKLMKDVRRSEKALSGTRSSPLLH